MPLSCLFWLRVNYTSQLRHLKTQLISGSFTAVSATCSTNSMRPQSKTSKLVLPNNPTTQRYITHFFRPTSSKIATRKQPTIPRKQPNLTLKTCIIKESWHLCFNNWEKHKRQLLFLKVYWMQNLKTLIITVAPLNATTNFRNPRSLML